MGPWDGYACSVCEHVVKPSHSLSFLSTVFVEEVFEVSDEFVMVSYTVACPQADDADMDLLDSWVCGGLEGISEGVAIVVMEVACEGLVGQSGYGLDEG